MNYFLGFTENAKILTVSDDELAKKYVAIKDIKPGDMVVSARTGKPITVVHCGFKKVKGIRLVQLKKNCFGENCPFEDTIVCDSLRIMMTILNTNVVTTFPLLLFPDKTNDLYIDKDMSIYNIDLEDNNAGVIVSGIPIQCLEINGIWERLGMTSN